MKLSCSCLVVTACMHWLPDMCDVWALCEYLRYELVHLYLLLVEIYLYNLSVFFYYRTVIAKIQQQSSFDHTLLSWPWEIIDHSCSKPFHKIHEENSRNIHNLRQSHFTVLVQLIMAQFLFIRIIVKCKYTVSSHCEPRKNTKMFSSCLPQNPVDSAKIWYALSWINLRYSSLNVFQLAWIMLLDYLLKLSIRIL